MNIATSPGVLGYVNPPAATAVTPDPITVLAGARNPKAAQQFVEFVLSLQGQALWVLPPEVPGGPPGPPLHRYPIRPDVFEKYNDQLVVKGNPFTERSDFHIDPKENQAYTQLLPHLVKAACSPSHFALQKAWKKAAAEGPNSKNLAALRQPPFDRGKALEYAELWATNPEKANALIAEWSDLFAKRYRAVLGEAAP